MFLYYMKQSTCLREISFTCFKTYNAVTSGIRFAFLCAIRRPSVCPFVRKFFSRYRISFETTGQIFFDTCLRCSPTSLVMSARKWFQSVDKCGRRQPSLIFTFIVSSPKPLEEFCRNLAYGFLSMSRCVRPKMISVCQKQMAIFRIVNCSLLNTVSLSHLLRDHCECSHQIFCIMR